MVLYIRPCDDSPPTSGKLNKGTSQVPVGLADSEIGSVRISLLIVI
nr:MAG TPA: hypothetical protein [Caudoviricetes sp.]